MKMKLNIFSILFCIIFVLKVQANLHSLGFEKAATINLALHYNFGNNDAKWSAAAKMTYWYSEKHYDKYEYLYDQYSPPIIWWEPVYEPYESYSFGIEADFRKIFDKMSGFRIFAEIQGTPHDPRDLPLSGYSIGPVVELSSIALGIQGSCWANIFIGIDLRGRFMWFFKNGLISTLSPGMYLTIPFNVKNKYYTSYSGETEP